MILEIKSLIIMVNDLQELSISNFSTSSMPTTRAHTHTYCVCI